MLNAVEAEVRSKNTFNTEQQYVLAQLIIACGNSAWQPVLYHIFKIILSIDWFEILSYNSFTYWASLPLIEFFFNFIPKHSD